VRVVGVDPIQVSQEGLEAPAARQCSLLVAAQVPLAHHVGLVPGVVHVLRQNLPPKRRERKGREETERREGEEDTFRRLAVKN